MHSVQSEALKQNPVNSKWKIVTAADLISRMSSVSDLPHTHLRHSLQKQDIKSAVAGAAIREIK